MKTCCGYSLQRLLIAGLHSGVDIVSNCRSISKFESQPVHITFMEIDHEIISFSPSIDLIKEGQLSVTGESTG